MLFKGFSKIVSSFDAVGKVSANSMVFSETEAFLIDFVLISLFLAGLFTAAN